MDSIQLGQTILAGLELIRYNNFGLDANVHGRMWVEQACYIHMQPGHSTSGVNWNWNDK